MKKALTIVQACKGLDCLFQGLNRYTDQSIPHTLIPEEPKYTIVKLQLWV